MKSDLVGIHAQIATERGAIAPPADSAAASADSTAATTAGDVNDDDSASDRRAREARPTQRTSHTVDRTRTAQSESHVVTRWFEGPLALVRTRYARARQRASHAAALALRCALSLLRKAGTTGPPSQNATALVSGVISGVTGTA